MNAELRGLAISALKKVPGTSRISLAGTPSIDSLGQKVPGTFSSSVAHEVCYDKFHPQPAY
jgi:hypothetical protein